MTTSNNVTDSFVYVDGSRGGTRVEWTYGLEEETPGTGDDWRTWVGSRRDRVTTVEW